MVLTGTASLVLDKMGHCFLGELLDFFQATSQVGDSVVCSLPQMVARTDGAE